MGRIDSHRLGTITAWTLVGAWAAWALIRLFGLEWGPLVAPMAFTPYVALGAVVPIALAVLLGRRSAALAAVAVAVLFAALVLPRAFGGPSEAASSGGPELRVLAANVKFGKADSQALVELARELEVDVLAVEELTPSFAHALHEEGLDELLAHSVVADQPSASGTGLYARIPLNDGSTEPLPGGFSIVHAQAVLPGADALELTAVHTIPPTDPTASSWGADLEALPSTSAPGPPRILLGDFNATLDQDQFRDLLGRGYADAGETLGDGLTPTWPTNRRFPPLVTIDHVLADERIGIRDYSVEELPGSDHRAVFAELALPAG